MVARTIILIIVTALVLVGFIFLAPLDVILKARGYTPTQIATVKEAFAPEKTAPGTANAALGASSPTQAASNKNTGNKLEDKPQSKEPLPKAAPDSSANNASKPAALEPQPEPAPAPARKFVATDTINVRAGQGTDTSVVGKLEPKSVVEVLEDPDGDWMKVTSGSVTGWVYKPLFERAP